MLHTINEIWKINREMFAHGTSLAGGSAKPTIIICCTIPLRIVRVSANHEDAVCDCRDFTKVKYVSVAITGLCVFYF